MPTYIHTCIHTYIHAYIHTYMRKDPNIPSTTHNTNMKKKNNLAPSGVEI